MVMAGWNVADEEDLTPPDDMSDEEALNTWHAKVTNREKLKQAIGTVSNLQGFVAPDVGARDIQTAPSMEPVNAAATADASPVNTPVTPSSDLGLRQAPATAHAFAGAEPGNQPAPVRVEAPPESDQTNEPALPNMDAVHKMRANLIGNVADLPPNAKPEKSVNPVALGEILSTGYGELPPEQRSRVLEAFRAVWGKGDGSPVSAAQALTAAQKRNDLEVMMTIEDHVREGLEGVAKGLPWTQQEREHSAQEALDRSGGNLQKAIEKNAKAQEIIGRGGLLAKQVQDAGMLAPVFGPGAGLSALMRTLSVGAAASPTTEKLAGSAAEAAGASPDGIFASTARSFGKNLPYFVSGNVEGALAHGGNLLEAAGKGALESAGGAALEEGAKQTGTDVQLPIVGSAANLVGAGITGKAIGLAENPAVRRAVGGAFRSLHEDETGGLRLPGGAKPMINTEPPKEENNLTFKSSYEPLPETGVKFGRTSPDAPGRSDADFKVGDYKVIVTDSGDEMHVSFIRDFGDRPVDANKFGRSVWAGRNPGGSVSGLREVGAFVENLQRLNPDREIVANPTDSRRAQVYKAAGFDEKSVNEHGYEYRHLVLNHERLLQALTPEGTLQKILGGGEEGMARVPGGTEQGPYRMPSPTGSGSRTLGEGEIPHELEASRLESTDPNEAVGRSTLKRLQGAGYDVKELRTQLNDLKGIGVDDFTGRNAKTQYEKARVKAWDTIVKTIEKMEAPGRFQVKDTRAAEIIDAEAYLKEKEAQLRTLQNKGPATQSEADLDFHDRLMKRTQSSIEHYTNMLSSLKGETAGQNAAYNPLSSKPGQVITRKVDATKPAAPAAKPASDIEERRAALPTPNSAKPAEAPATSSVAARGFAGEAGKPEMKPVTGTRKEKREALMENIKALGGTPKDFTSLNDLQAQFDRLNKKNVPKAPKPKPKVEKATPAVATAAEAVQPGGGWAIRQAGKKFEVYDKRFPEEAVDSFKTRQEAADHIREMAVIEHKYSQPGAATNDELDAEYNPARDPLTYQLGSKELGLTGAAVPATAAETPLSKRKAAREAIMQQIRAKGGVVKPLTTLKELQAQLDALSAKKTRAGGAGKPPEKPPEAPPAAAAAPEPEPPAGMSAEEKAAAQARIDAGKAQLGVKDVPPVTPPEPLPESSRAPAPKMDADHIYPQEVDVEEANAQAGLTRKQIQDELRTVFGAKGPELRGTRRELAERLKARKEAQNPYQGTEAGFDPNARLNAGVEKRWLGPGEEPSQPAYTPTPSTIDERRGALPSANREGLTPADQSRLDQVRQNRLAHEERASEIEKMSRLQVIRAIRAEGGTVESGTAKEQRARLLELREANLKPEDAAGGGLTGSVEELQARLDAARTAGGGGQPPEKPPEAPPAAAAPEPEEGPKDKRTLDLEATLGVGPAPKSGNPILDGAIDKIMDHALDNVLARENGTIDAQISRGRSQQASSQEQAFIKARFDGLSGMDQLAAATGGGRVGQLGSTISPIKLSAEEAEAMARHVADKVANHVEINYNGEKRLANTFDTHVARRVLAKLLTGTRLQPDELKHVFAFYGPELGEAIRQAQADRGKVGRGLSGPKTVFPKQEFPPTQGNMLEEGKVAPSAAPKQTWELKDGQWVQTNDRDLANPPKIESGVGLRPAEKPLRKDATLLEQMEQGQGPGVAVPMSPHPLEGQPSFDLAKTDMSDVHQPEPKPWHLDPRYLLARERFEMWFNRAHPDMVGGPAHALERARFDSQWLAKMADETGLSVGVEAPVAPEVSAGAEQPAIPADLSAVPVNQNAKPVQQDLGKGRISLKLPGPDLAHRIGRLGWGELKAAPGVFTLTKTALHLVIGRQGEGFMAFHPTLWKGVLRDLGRLITDPEAHKYMEAGLDDHPWVGGDYTTEEGRQRLTAGITANQMMNAGKLHRSEHGFSMLDVDPESRDPAYANIKDSHIVRAIMKIPGVERVIAWNTAYLNKVRKLGYAEAAQRLWDQGIHNDNNLDYTAAAHAMDIVTGRGSVRVGGNLLFSGRNVSAKAEVLGMAFGKGSGSPLPWSGSARSIALQSVMGDLAAGLTTLGLGWATGVTNVNWMPNEPAWLKATVGGTGLDPFGGGLTMPKFLLKMSEAAYKGSTDDFKTAVQQLVTGQLGPLTGEALSLWTGKDWAGNKFHIKDRLGNNPLKGHSIVNDLLVPIAFESLWDAMRQGYQKGTEESKYDYHGTGGVNLDGVVKGALRGAFASPSLIATGVETPNTLASQVTDLKAKAQQRWASEGDYKGALKAQEVDFSPAGMPSTVMKAAKLAGLNVDPDAMMASVQGSMKHLTYRELPSGARKLVDDGALTINPDLHQAYQDERLGRGDIYAIQTARVDALRKDAEKEMQTLSDSKQNNYGKDLKKIQDRLQHEINKLYTNEADPITKQYLDAVKTLTPNDPRRWEDAWQQVYTQAANLDEKGNVDFDKVDQWHANQLKNLAQNDPDNYNMLLASLGINYAKSEAAKAPLLQLHDKMNKQMSDYNDLVGQEKKLQAQEAATPDAAGKQKVKESLAQVVRSKEAWLIAHPKENAADWMENGVEPRTVAALNIVKLSGLKSMDSNGNPSNYHLANTTLGMTDQTKPFFDLQAQKIEQLLQSDARSNPNLGMSPRQALLEQDIVSDALHYVLGMAPPSTSADSYAKGKVAVYHDPVAIQALLVKWGLKGRDDGAAMYVP